jgi:hypothetical protein
MSERCESNGGGGNCTRVFDSASIFPRCGYDMASGDRPQMGREKEALRELVAAWHLLTLAVRERIMQVAHGAS